MLQETTFDQSFCHDTRVFCSFSSKFPPPGLTSLLSRSLQPGTCQLRAVAMMSRFPTERVISLFSTVAHVVLHFIQQPNNHPFVWPGRHTRATMPYAEQNTGILQQNFDRVWAGIVAEGLSSACAGWNGILIHTGDARHEVGGTLTQSETFEAEQP